MDRDENLDFEERRAFFHRGPINYGLNGLISFKRVTIQFI